MLCEGLIRLKMTMQSNIAVHQAEPQTPERLLHTGQTHHLRKQRARRLSVCLHACECEKEERWAWVTWVWACTQATDLFNQVSNFQNRGSQRDRCSWRFALKSSSCCNKHTTTPSCAHKNYVLQGLNVYNKRSLPGNLLSTAVLQRIFKQLS